jgi:hypothetical protein
MLTAAILAAAQGHGHTLSVPAGIGPVILRVALLAAVPVVAGFALLRAFRAEQTRTTVTFVAATAAGLVMLELMLADGLDILTDELVPLLMAALAVPLYLIRSRDPRFTVAVRRARALVPWMLTLTTVLGLIEFGRAWFSDTRPDATAVLLHSGVIFTLLGLCWFAAWVPAGRATTILVRGQAALLASALVAGAAFATVLRPPYPPTTGVAMVSQIEIGGNRLAVAVVPHRPGWNLVHVQGDEGRIGTSPDTLVTATARPGTTGTWAMIRLPEGRTPLWIGHRDGLGVLPLDTGNATGPWPSLDGADGPECASALLGSLLAGRELSRCPADELTERDAETLRAKVSFIAARGVRDITVSSDSSPRSVAAELTIRTAATAAGISVAPMQRPQGPLLVVSGWSAAEDTLRRTASGTLPVTSSYLAPWLLTSPLLTINAAQHIPLRFTPGEDAPARYLDALRAQFPGETPSAAGYAAATGSTVDHPVRMHVVAGDTAAQGRTDEWPTGLTVVSGPLNAQ